MADRAAVRIALLLVWGCLAYEFAGTAAPATPPQMVTVPGKDVNGTIYKKLGLPDRHYCWDMCLKDEH